MNPPPPLLLHKSMALCFLFARAHVKLKTREREQNYGQKQARDREKIVNINYSADKQQVPSRELNTILFLIYLIPAARCFICMRLKTPNNNTQKQSVFMQISSCAICKE
jgi:hypothetical protein